MRVSGILIGIWRCVVLTGGRQCIFVTELGPPVQIGPVRLETPWDIGHNHTLFPVSHGPNIVKRGTAAIRGMSAGVKK